MIERLLALFLQAKSGAIGSVLLVSASGAIVTATTHEGVTTVTVTQASPSPSASARPSASPRPTASPARSASPSARPSATPRDTRACGDAMRSVNAAFTERHTALARLQGPASRFAGAKAALKEADDLLRGIRKAATAAIRRVEGCADVSDPSKEPAPRAIDGLILTGDPASIVREATAAMDLVMERFRSAFPQLAAQPQKDGKPQPAKDRGKGGDKDSRSKGDKRKQGPAEADPSGSDSAD